jgi:hypothetical protein
MKVYVLFKYIDFAAGIDAIHGVYAMKDSALQIQEKIGEENSFIEMYQVQDIDL